jgi:hypothetical protein
VVYAGGVLVLGTGVGGRSRVEPFGAVEGQVLFFDGQRVCVDPEGQRGIRVAELVGDPANRPTRVECEAGECVPSRVELQWSDAELLGAATNAIPAARHIPLVQGRACFRAEHPRRHFWPSPSQALLATLRREVEERGASRSFGPDRSSVSRIFPS